MMCLANIEIWRFIVGFVRSIVLKIKKDYSFWLDGQELRINSITCSWVKLRLSLRGENIEGALVVSFGDKYTKKEDDIFLTLRIKDPVRIRGAEYLVKNINVVGSQVCLTLNPGDRKISMSYQGS